MFNLKQHNFKYHGLPWPTVFCGVLWFLWKWRYQLIFLDNFTSPSHPLYQVIQFLSAWHNANYFHSALKLTQIVQIRWHPLLPGWCKLNTDGSRTSDGKISAGLLHDSCGSWVLGFIISIGVGTIHEVELWGLFEGLHMT